MSTSCLHPFRSDLPLTRKGGPSTVDTEDEALTRYLIRELKAARSTSLKPSACPYCQSHLTTLISRPHARMPMPTFRCTACLRQFNRLTGTPLARLRHADKLFKFVRLLSCQISYKEAAEILQVDYSAIANWAEKFRTWLLQLDPSGAQAGCRCR
jgi:transposase-like protein